MIQKTEITAEDAAQAILENKLQNKNATKEATFFAPSNIALIKYWGKRHGSLRLPCNDSLSISLGDLGCHACVQFADDHDHIILNDSPVDTKSNIALRTFNWLDHLLTKKRRFFNIKMDMNIPLGAGLASSACWFASLTGAFNHFFAWQLDSPSLSILARLGSGSACRSLQPGFMHWKQGEKEDGTDSYAEPLNINWPSLRIGLYIIDASSKKIDSQTAMMRSMLTSPLFAVWPKVAAHHLQQLQLALETKDFATLGQVSENNAIFMHRLIEGSNPSFSYSTSATLDAREKVKKLRQQGIAVYFTQDAGANLKLIFEEDQQNIITHHFPELMVVNPWARQA